MGQNLNSEEMLKWYSFCALVYKFFSAYRLFFKWTSDGSTRPENGSLVKLVTKEGNTALQNV